MAEPRLNGESWDLVPFLKSDFNFAILQASGNVTEEIDRFHNLVIGVVNNFAPSFRNIPEISSIPEHLASSKFLSILNTLSDSILAKINFSFKLYFS